MQKTYYKKYMHKILTVDTWKLFLYLLIPYIFMDNSIGFIVTICWSFGLTVVFFVLGRELDVKHKNRFRLFYWYFISSILIIFAYLILTCILFFTGYNIIKNAFDGIVTWKDFLFITLHIMTTFSFFYCIIYLSNRIVKIENKNNSQTKEYIKTYLQFALITFGIWWLQPRIKKILTAE
jgi:glucan phosphoethanolaminetransferase (alkaline phosphatase superfamily)